MLKQNTSTTKSSNHPFNLYVKKWWIDNRERIAEWYRLYFHTIVVTILIAFNQLVGYSAFLIYLAKWKHMQGGSYAALSLIMKNPPAWLIGIMDSFFIPMDKWPIGWMFFFFNLILFTWLYSTITQPIKKGQKTIIDWTSKKGRIWAAVLSGIPFAMVYISLFAWFVDQYLFHIFASIKAPPEKDFLVVQSMESFGYVLFAVPVFIILVGTYLVLKQFYMFEDLPKQFYRFRFPLLDRQSFSLKNNSSDVIIGWEKKTNKPIVLKENSRYLHELVVGATGTGKTSTAILIRIVQDLIRIARGKKQGLIVLEPKGDLVRDVIKLSEQLGIPKEKIKIVDPTDLVHSVKFNPFDGPMHTAAETFRGVLNALTGDQDEFFKGQQEETASSYTLLGKIRYGNQFNIHHIQKMYLDPRYLADITEQVRAGIEKKKEVFDTLSESEKKELKLYERVVEYFENEVLEYKTMRHNNSTEIQPILYPENHKYAGRQMVENKKDKYVTGAKKYINDIAMNSMLSQLMISKDGEEILDLDKFLNEGGVLLVNTALGELEELSLLFGQFFIRQFQSSVFRRPPEENGYKRIPVFFYIDEFPLYINEAFERMLTLGRSYKVGTLISIQSLGQLKTVIRGYDEVILTNASNKTVFGRGSNEDNKRFSEQFGEEIKVEESLNESVTPVTMPNQSWGYRYNTQRKVTKRFTPTDIMEQEFKHFIVQIVDEDGSFHAPVQAYGKFINETKFIKKFINIGQIELATKNHKSINLVNHLSNYKSLIRSSFSLGNQSLEQKDDIEINNESENELFTEVKESSSPKQLETSSIDLPMTNLTNLENEELIGVSMKEIAAASTDIGGNLEFDNEEQKLLLDVNNGDQDLNEFIENENEEGTLTATTLDEETNKHIQELLAKVNDYSLLDESNKVESEQPKNTNEKEDEEEELVIIKDDEEKIDDFIFIEPIHVSNDSSISDDDSSDWKILDEFAIETEKKDKNYKKQEEYAKEAILKIDDIVEDDD